MKRLLLILCISVIIAGVIALAFSALQGYGYYHLLDGDADMVSGLHWKMILFFAIGIILVMIGVTGISIRR